MSQVKYQAFTVISSRGRLREILTPAKISVASQISDIFKIPQQIIEVKVLWDTGASATSISKRLATQLNLAPVSRQKVLCAGQPYESPMYKIDLYLLDRVRFKDVTVTEFENSPKFDILIGMDIITTGDFSLTNANEHTVCSFKIPAGPHHVDYVKEIGHKKNVKAAVKNFKRKERRRRH